MATYMQAVNITLPNAALLDMQGTLSMANDEVGWVFTSYIAASVIIMPMTRWLAGRYGRKAIYQFSIAVFALGLVLDTLATTPIQFVLARIVQGAVSGTLAPLSMAILLDVLPPKRHARISLVWTVCLMLGIASGASIGSWLSEYHGWRSIFYISLSMSGFIFLAVGLSLPEKKAEQNPIKEAFAIRNQFLSGSDTSIEAMTERLGITKGRLASLVRLSYLAPDIVRALLDGRQLIELTPTRLFRLSKDLPHEWSEHRHFLGFAEGRSMSRNAL